MIDLTRFWEDRTGNFAVLFALTFLGVAAFVGLGIDVYREQSTKIALVQVVNRTCQRIESSSGMVTQSSSDLTAQAVAFANAQKSQSLSNASFSVSNSGSTYTVNGSSQVPVTVMAVLGRRVVPVAATAQCDNTSYAPQQCTNPIFMQNAPIGITISNGTLTQAQPQPSGPTVYTTANTGLANGQDYVVSLVSDDQPAVVYYRGFYKGDYSGSFKISSSGQIARFGTIDATGLQVDSNDSLYIQPINTDGSIPVICPSQIPACVGASCGTCSGSSCATNPVSSPSTTPPPSAKCGPNYAGTYGNSPTKSLYNSSNFSSADTFAYGSAVANYASVNNQAYIPLASNYGQNTTSIKVAGVTSHGDATQFFSTYQNLYVHNMIDQNSANLKTLSSGPGWLAYVKGPTAGIWIDSNGNCAEYDSPVALDLIGLGKIATTGQTTAQFGRRAGLGKTVKFDFFGDGKPVAVEWLTGNGQGFLVDNRDGHAIDRMDGRRLFGNLDGYADGYAKLAAFDHSGSGILRGHDLDGLAVWIDDGSAVPTKNNVISAKDLGLTEIGLTATRERDERGDVVLRSWAVVHGKRILSEDIWLGIAR